MIEARKRAYRVAKPRAPGLKRVGNDESHLLRIARHARGMCITGTKHALDPAFTTAIETCSYWRQRTEDPIRLIHDKSSSLAKDKPLWDLLTSPDIEERTIGIPGRQTKYPLKVVATAFTDSRTHLQLQFCDLIAGATAAWCRQFLHLPYGKDYTSRLERAGIEDLRIGQIWPQAEVYPERLGMKGWSGEGVDFLAEQLERLDRKSSEDDH